MDIAAEAFAAVADALPDLAGSVGYRIKRATLPGPTSFALRAVITEGEQQLTMIGDAAAPTNTPTKTLRVLYADWPQPTPPQVDDEVELPDGSIYRVASVERRIGDYYLITASKRKGR